MSRRYRNCPAVPLLTRTRTRTRTGCGGRGGDGDSERPHPQGPFVQAHQRDPAAYITSGATGRPDSPCQRSKMCSPGGISCTEKLPSNPLKINFTNSKGRHPRGAPSLSNSFSKTDSKPLLYLLCAASYLGVRRDGHLQHCLVSVRTPFAFVVVVHLDSAQVYCRYYRSIWPKTCEKVLSKLCICIDGHENSL